MKKYINSTFCLLATILCNNAFSYDKFTDGLRYDSAPIPSVVYDSSGNIMARYWPNGIIPYQFALNEYSEIEKNAIKSVMRYLEKNANISFREVSGIQNSYVNITKYETHRRWQTCGSRIGKTDEIQTLFIDDSCLYRYGEYDNLSRTYKKEIFYGYILHEIMHLLGLDHEQTRSDRDDHIIYLNENYYLHPNDKMENQLNYKIRKEKFSSSVTDYDYSSRMQYHAYTAQKSGTTLPIMIPKKCLPQYLKNPAAFAYENLDKLEGCDELKLMANPSEELTRLDICTLQVMYGVPQGVPNPVDCGDVFSRLSRNKKVTKSEDANSSGEKLLVKRSPKKENNEKSNIATKLFMPEDRFDIINCKKIKEFIGDWKEIKKNNILSYYRYFSEKNGTCKQEIHTYKYDTKNKVWSDKVEKIFINVD